MTARLAHRGPDGHGVHGEPGLFFGHTRLAILDLSPAGRQPMFSASGRYVITYNGEIYNFMALRAELELRGHHFVSTSDTEVLLESWAEWGEACLDRLDGIFAFALYDRQERTLFLARDHLGVKPLFYHVDDGQIAFASEPHAMFGTGRPCPGADPEDLDTYFTFSYLPAPRTGWKGVKQLLPGSFLRIDRGGEQLTRYWDMNSLCASEPWTAESPGIFKERLLGSVKSQLVSDAPLGLLLSGGLDSFSVASCAVASGRKPVAFTLGFSEPRFDETASAGEYAAFLGIDSRITLFEWTEPVLVETLGALNELMADPSCWPFYQLSRFARKGAAVVLAGDGGDELLAGYDTYKAGEVTPYIRCLPSFVRSMMRGAAGLLPSDDSRMYPLRVVAERILSAAGEGRGRDHCSFRRIFSRAAKKRLYDPDFRAELGGHDPIAGYAELIRRAPAAKSYLAARQYADLQFHLPSILAKVDRMSMASGLEVRVPILSRSMVEYSLGLPDEAKRWKGRGKRILREAFEKSIPQSALKRPKTGFLPPVDQWFRQDGLMKNVFGDYLQTARRDVPLLRWTEVEALWSEHKAGKVDAGMVLLNIMQFINWNMKCRTRR